MGSTKTEGTLREAAGDVQRAAGELLGNAGAQVSGAAQELSGKAQQVYSDFAEGIRESTVQRPLLALAIAAGLGFIFGALRVTSGSRRSKGRSD